MAGGERILLLAFFIGLSAFSATGNDHISFLMGFLEQLNKTVVEGFAEVKQHSMSLKLEMMELKKEMGDLNLCGKGGGGGGGSDQISRPVPHRPGNSSPRRGKGKTNNYGGGNDHGDHGDTHNNKFNASPTPLVFAHSTTEGFADGKY